MRVWLVSDPLPRLAVFGILVLAIVLLAACGVSPAASQTPPTATVIQATATPLPPTSVTVLRFGGPADQNRVAPFTKTAQDAANVQRLYNAVFALPPNQPRAVGCPIDLFIGYELSFMHGNTLVLEVLMTGGCPIVKLVGLSGCHTWTSDFTEQIAATLGVTLQPRYTSLNTAGPNGPFAPAVPTPFVPLPVRC